MLRCSIIGATSYTASELIRLLSNHPEAKITCLTTRQDEVIPVAKIAPALAKSDLVIKKQEWEEVANASDVVFLTLPHTAAMDFAEKFLSRNKVVIDLSADFRLKDASLYEQWYKKNHVAVALLSRAVYGLPEFYRERIKTADLIANPGCYPTGIILGMLPLLKNDLVERESLIVDSKSGVSGAGRKLSETTQFCEVNENFSAYKVNCHQHTPEIEQVLSEIAKAQVRITFVPHLLPVNRGILSTIYLRKKRGISKEQILEAFADLDAREPFIKFMGEGKFPSLHDVQYTNYCNIGVHVDEPSGRVIVITAIDNLMKGASSQAVQNMNIRFGISETAGVE